MILVVNTGSSSLKYKLFNADFEVEKSGSFSNIGGKIKNHSVAVEIMVKELGNSLSEISKVGYRVVHGGDEAEEVMPITLNTIKIIKKYAHLAPHHNPPAEKVIRNLIEKIPLSQHFAVFDIAFFKELPEVATTYAIDYKIAQDLGIKRYGFHGISHEWVSEQLDPNKCKKVISLHLGAGSSVAAINCGKPIDTSMGFTPLEGLVMRVRSGDIDPGVVLYLVDKFGNKKARDLIENHSGLAGISETSGSMLSLLAIASEKVEDDNFNLRSDESVKNANADLAKLAIEIYCYKVKKYIGAYAAALGGVDIVAFTGEIGFGSSVIRKKITSELSFLNFKTETVKPDEELAIAKKL